MYAISIVSGPNAIQYAYNGDTLRVVHDNGMGDVLASRPEFVARMTRAMAEEKIKNHVHAYDPAATVIVERIAA